MIKKYLAVFLCLVVVGNGLAQSRSKAKQPRQMKQPREVIEAYQVCREFQSLLAENLDFDRAFEKTFVTDQSRRREVAIAEGDHGEGDLSKVDTATIVDIYKSQSQVFVLFLPLILVDDKDKAELFPPSVEAIFDQKPPNDPQQLQAYSTQLKLDVKEFRAHFEKVAATNPEVAKTVQEYKQYLLRPLEPPNSIVKPLTAYSKGRVLGVNEPYYQIDDCAVIREGAQMKLIGYIFFKMRF